MIFQIKAYLKIFLSSTNQHGVHSPFVYDLVTKCFYDKTKFQDYLKLKAYKKELLKNRTQINITDFGAGSKVIKNNKRTVSNIAKHSGTTLKRAKLLYRLVNYFNSSSILELGTSLGIGTHAMSLANPKAYITTIEGCANISKFTKENFKRQKLQNIELITSNFSNAINNLTPKTYDLIFFDGNHQKEATLNYFETLLPTTHNNTIFIFDDIYWSKGMTEAWEAIKQHPKVTVTIDTFFWGFVFFRKEQEKEHFTIRV
ncbi:O-methyltransferase [Pontimicrobium aquaticum]|uniref:Class I SAM-dependent methyltransferase n=1 Tax=Pontimicrobium aquaticum TaxID=2565367 RepID=A0A4U0EP73_9FLAO|nr:class I SAM-dependent methyltransferase [Pontimicrobium aquaticum]TJY32884.1 class I SAM-dependent methyltransferase [Pontimicrobium aquaticum]